MKKLLIPMAAVLLLAACNSTPKDKAATTEAQKVSEGKGEPVPIDTVASYVGWRATHKGGVDPHNGTIKLSESTVYIDNGQVTAGNFLFNITSITDLDLKDAKKKAQLEGHLKSADFFDIAKYPTAKFEVTKIAPYDSTKAASAIKGATNIVSGNLTFKDSTINVTFPAVISINGKSVTLKAQFSIDRTSWGLNYKGPDNPQDWLIEKKVDLELNIRTL